VGVAALGEIPDEITCRNWPVRKPWAVDRPFCEDTYRSVDAIE